MARTFVPVRSSVGKLGDLNKQMRGIEAAILRVINKIDDVTPEAVLYGLQPAYDLSQQLVPVDTGKLQRSGFLEIIGKRRRSETKVVIGYGRRGHPYYAVYVHEMLHVRHQKGKQAKFLEAAVNQKLGNLERRVVNYIKQHAGIE